ncbi:MAG: DNA-directed RNA polymerase, subunit E'' [Candidatus Micrarchaeota archaeon]|nr:DNA-directed RNA polymerase, subunit E'' [Candidatus Micrarchaeota archaeon]
MKACKSCRLIVEDYALTCPACQGADLTEKFSGQLVVNDPEKSEIGKKLSVKVPGKYAIKIRR